ncbi:hypothetical protein [Arthrobacter globiformis]|uniref:hypothetical protein n=1 Tax=Arthrobacter globiformis TaxID=1665 RepID=UPI00278ED74C|nr:hypothetical protein [Arthrobacter globiformis]MDQ0616399.1 hypothetical protein [Arthrobacter globiformis]
MDSTGMMALFLAGSDSLATSALPQAPTVAENSTPRSAAWNTFRGRTASVLHRLAWAVEPKAPGSR